MLKRRLKKENKEVKIFKGWKGLQKAFSDCITPLTSKDVICVFVLSTYAGADKNKIRDLRVKIRDWIPFSEPLISFNSTHLREQTFNCNHNKTAYSFISS